MKHGEYFDYIQKHQAAVKEVWFNQLREYINEFVDEDTITIIDNNISAHDASKYELEEFVPYDNYFYRKSGDEESAKIEFDIAWLHHQNKNKHHWQYWVLRQEGLEESSIRPLNMPIEYIVEMICDWQSFAITTDPTNTAYRYYSKHKDKMMLTKYTRSVVEDILAYLEDKGARD